LTAVNLAVPAPSGRRRRLNISGGSVCGGKLGIRHQKNSQEPRKQAENPT
jgi:hypothetical protein